MRIRIKLAIIALLVVLLTVPLFLVVSKIYERDGYHEQVRADISRSWTGEQKIIGPILVVPYTVVYEKREYDKDLKRYVMNTYSETKTLFILPEALNSDVELETEIRYRGIYEVPVYGSTVTMSGHFSSKPIERLATRSDVTNIGKAYVSITVNDMRGIAVPPLLDWDSKQVKFLPGSNVAFQPNGIHAPLSLTDRINAGNHNFSLTLSLRGMSSFRFAPVGDANTTTFASSWEHPKFEGSYLPARHDISTEGFTATWQTSAFATNINRKAQKCADGDCSEFLTSYFGVQLIDPIDVYLQAQRASKYGILFIGLTFTAFFLFEVLKKLEVHPIQYALVGTALTVFYLLLVSLAEHIAFAWAYTIATVACSGLLAFYISFVLKSLVRGTAFGAAIAGLYGVLYIIIQEEDYAFSMGAGLVFIALTGVMYITRHVDWFLISRSAFNQPDTISKGDETSVGLSDSGA